MVWNVFFQDWIAFHVAYHSLFTHSCPEGHLWWFRFLAAMIYSAIKIWLKVFNGLKVLALLSKYLNVHLLYHMIRLYLAEKNLPDSFECISITAFPLAVNSFSGSLPVSSSLIWTSVFLVCSFICVVFLFLFHYYYYFSYRFWGLLFPGFKFEFFLPFCFCPLMLVQWFV